MFSAAIHPGLETDIDREGLKNGSVYLNPGEENKIRELREWSHHFFNKYSLKYIASWTALNEPVDLRNKVRQEYRATSVDIVLKVVKVVKRKEVTFRLRDCFFNEYSLYEQMRRHIKQGDVLLLREIDV